MKHALALTLLLSGCMTAQVAAPALDARPQAPTHIDTQLARFMREAMNVPFSFAVMEHDGRQRPVRFARAALVLQDAVQDLVHWADPPVKTVSAREVFYTYARQLEGEVSAFEEAARAHDMTETSARLERIRQTCNSCHHFFRPASVISRDVVYDRFAADLGGEP